MSHWTPEEARREIEAIEEGAEHVLGWDPGQGGQVTLRQLRELLRVRPEATRVVRALDYLLDTGGHIMAAPRRDR